MFKFNNRNIAHNLPHALPIHAMQPPACTPHPCHRVPPPACTPHPCHAVPPPACTPHPCHAGLSFPFTQRVLERALSLGDPSDWTVYLLMQSSEPSHDANEYINIHFPPFFHSLICFGFPGVLGPANKPHTVCSLCLWSDKSNECLIPWLPGTNLIFGWITKSYVAPYYWRKEWKQ